MIRPSPCNATSGFLMTNPLTHFEIYGEQPTSLAEFYSRVFGWQVERMEAMDYWRINTGSDEANTLNGSLIYRAIPALTGWMLYVQVPTLDETVELAKIGRLGSCRSDNPSNPLSGTPSA